MRFWASKANSMRDPYEQFAFREMKAWQKTILRKPSLANRIAVFSQQRWNRIIPEKVHRGVTMVMEKMVKGVLFAARYSTFKTKNQRSFAEKETRADQLISRYQHTASVEGAVAGSGGFLLGLAELPVLIGLKMKMLFDLANVYGYDVSDYRERLYILHIFQLTFSSQAGRQQVYERMANWHDYARSLPVDSDDFDWRCFQQEYRDYIDLAKMLQLIPYLGAVVGFVVNKRLLRQLGHFAKNSYRMRYFKQS